MAAEEAQKKRIADAAVEAERKRVADQARVDKADADRREANKKHKGKIHSEILSGIESAMKRSYEADPDPDKAIRAIVEAMARGEIPHVVINY